MHDVSAQFCIIRILHVYVYVHTYACVVCAGGLGVGDHMTCHMTPPL